MERRTRLNKGIVIEQEDGTVVENLDVDEIDEVMEDPNSFKNKALVAFTSAKDYTTTAFWVAFDACSIYMMWILLHYVSAHLYTYFCAPSTIVGFIYSPFVIAAPHCRALRWVIFNGSVSIDNMWIVFGTWLCSKILIPRANA
jgi:hypothetical protein